MNVDAAHDGTRAMLYGGTLGAVYPRDWCERGHGADAWVMTTECLVIAPIPSQARVDVLLRFLSAGGVGTVAPACEREVRITGVQLDTAWPVVVPIVAPSIDPDVVLRGTLEVRVVPGTAYRVRVRVFNETPCLAHQREQMLPAAFLSPHVVLSAQAASFISRDVVLASPGDSERRRTWPGTW